MKIDVHEYDRMRAWLGCVTPEVFPSPRPDSNPVTALDQVFATSSANARKGLAMAVGDIIEAMEHWPAERVAAIDDRLRLEHLPTFTEIRLRFSKAINRIVRRGIIKNDGEYYAVRNAAQLAEDAEGLWTLLAAYEERATR